MTFSEAENTRMVQNQSVPLRMPQSRMTQEYPQQPLQHQIRLPISQTFGITAINSMPNKITNLATQQPHKVLISAQKEQGATFSTRPSVTVQNIVAGTLYNQQGVRFRMPRPTLSTQPQLPQILPGMI